MSLLVGLDLGSTTIKAVLYDSATGQVRRVARRATPLAHPRPTWSEHDPEQLWQAVCLCLREAVQGQAVQALAISSMAEAAVALDAAGKPVAPIIAWFDRRSTAQAAQVEETLGRASLYRLTGQRISASFGLTKWLWMRQYQPELATRTRFWLPLPAYILYRLCGVLAADASIASRSLLFDQTRRTWSTELLDLAGLTVAQLPQLASGGSLVGAVTPQAAGETGLSTATCCALGGHDHLCAAFCGGAMQPGAEVDSTGTAEAVVRVVDSFHPDPALGERGYACYGHVLPGLYVIKGGLKAAGASIEWLARLLSGPSDQPDYAALEAEARQTLGKLGPLWLPHLLESGSPQADPFSRGALVGARLEHARGDLFRGMLEGLACWLRQNLSDMRAAVPGPDHSLALLGGTTRLKLFCQIKADVLNQPLTLPQAPEAAGLGAALLAGIACGAFANPPQALASLSYGAETLTPDPQRSQAYQALYTQVYLPLYPALHELQRTL